MNRDKEYCLKICHLYSKQLNLYGDRGNMIALAKRCEWRGISAQIESCEIGESFDACSFDIVFLGGGQDFEQNLIRNDLLEVKRPSILRGVEEGVVFLCICGGYQMMGEYYIDQSGEKIDCLNAIPIRTETGGERLIGNLICTSEELRRLGADPLLIGFENHSGRTFLGDGAVPLAEIITGSGNNGRDTTEGARFRNVFCTYMHGSFLPKNPAMADLIITTALKRKYPDFTRLDDIADEFEASAREELKKRYKIK
ncbi:MAG: glutamine amidotransferase [Eubacteriales bacterium]|jgi:CobQ-like glutamine amidotransferase family enzyme|nr:glutamine amidotransferase [Eubacteriales bacterium]